MNSSRFDWLLFDLDNTLFDFTSSSKSAFAALLEYHQVTWSEAHWQAYNEVNESVWAMLEKGLMPAKDVKWQRFHRFFEGIDVQVDAHEANDLYLDELVAKSTLLPNTKKVLDDLHGNFRFAAITNGLEKVQRPRMEKTGILSYFDVIVVSEEIGVAKPQEEFFEYAFREMGQPNKHKCLVIGDSLHSDIEGANRFGLPSCWINALGKSVPASPKPDFTLRHVNQLREVL